eukprot:124114_1
MIISMIMSQTQEDYLLSRFMPRDIRNAKHSHQSGKKQLRDSQDMYNLGEFMVQIMCQWYVDWVHPFAIIRLYSPMLMVDIFRPILPFDDHKSFFDFIHEDYPTRHLWKGDETKLNNIYHKWQASDPKLPLLMVVTKKLNPSLLVSWSAKKYDGVIQFVHLYPKPASKTLAATTKQSTGRIRFLSNKLNEVFGVKKFVDYPKLITISAQGDATVIEEKINKHNLKAFTRNYIQFLIPEFTAWSYTSVCGEHDIVCIIYTKGCDGKKRDKLKKYIKLSRKTIPQVKDIQEAYHPKWVQFGYVDVMKDTLLRPLCAGSNDTELIIVSEAQTLMNIPDKKIDEFDDQILFEYIEMILNHEAETPTIDAPRIIPPPPPRRNVIDDMVEYIEELDWKDKDLQLNVVIICCLIGLVFVCKNCGLKGAVMTLFAMSIAGGMLPFIMGMLTGSGGGGPGAPPGGGRRGKGRGR